MSGLSRRSIFGLFAGAVAAPFVKVPVTPAPAAAAVVPAGLSLSDIVTATLRNRSGAIADSIQRNNPLLGRLAHSEHGRS